MLHLPHLAVILTACATASRFANSTEPETKLPCSDDTLSNFLAQTIHYCVDAPWNCVEGKSWNQDGYGGWVGGG